MPFEWINYLELFDFNKKQLNEKVIPESLIEAKIREMIHQAYYAAFNCSIEHAKENFKYDELELIYKQFKGQSSDSEVNTHSFIRVIFDFYHEQDSKHGYSKISNYLYNLRDYRNNCDYDKKVGDIDNKLINTETYAKQIIKSLNGINKSLVRLISQNSNTSKNFRKFLQNKNRKQNNK